MLAAFYLAFIDDEEDKDLFLSLYENYRDDMLRYAAPILKGKCEASAEDAVQEAYRINPYKDKLFRLMMP